MFLDHDAGVFDRIQNRYIRRDDYKYDAASIWTRASQRGIDILTKLNQHHVRVEHVIEVGCGDGMLGFWLAAAGVTNVCLVDMADWRMPFAKQMPMHIGFLEKGLPYRSNSADVIVSFNSFEHFEDPRACLNECMRILRPGGVLYLDFAPLFNSAWGLHVYRTIHVPYCQFLYSPKFIADKLEDLGIEDLGVVRSDRQPLNGWSANQFLTLLQQENMTPLLLRLGSDTSQISIIQEFPQAFRGRNLDVREVTTSRIEAMLRKE